MSNNFKVFVEERDAREGKKYGVRVEFRTWLPRIVYAGYDENDFPKVYPCPPQFWGTREEAERLAEKVRALPIEARCLLLKGRGVPR